ncbi:MAG: CDP-glycerol glycerophosphotransferase family protein [Methanobrevibacter sp.]|nr:CDP-glycerol glycerophosphotransferase family protein [Methanobrevibacter sp.]
MSYLKHKVYGFLFRLFRHSKIKDNSITFIIDSGESFKGNLDYIKKEFERRRNYEFHFFYKDKLSLKGFKELASSRFIFLNDNFFPLAFMNFNSKSTVVQLWHAPGASKKFGGSVDLKSRPILEKISQNTDYLISTSENIRDYYAEAFQMPTSKIKALGLPRMDYYFENHDLSKLKGDFCRKYNVSPDRKIILYAPTFRDEKRYNNVFDYLDLEKFNEVLSDDYVLALRLHPKIRNFYADAISSNGEYIDVSDFESEQELMLISDILITDYSSIMIEYSALEKPTVFFTYDLEDYLANERGFYYDFKSTVPGPIVHTSDELIKTIKDYDFDKSKISEFVKTQFDEIDGQSSKRIVDFLLNNGGKNE